MNNFRKLFFQSDGLTFLSIGLISERIRIGSVEHQSLLPFLNFRFLLSGLFVLAVEKSPKKIHWS